MKTRFLATIALLALAGPALAQSAAEHQQHHQGGAQPTQTQPLAGQMPMAQMPMGQMPMGQMMQNMMQAMPEQCRAAMQTMPQGCVAMMQRMMQGGMGGGMGMMQGHAMQAGGQSEASKAYMAAMSKMEGPMMQATQEPDPDVAFVKSMIPHHQSAIDMAKVVLQYGKDQQAKKWANDVIREQQREITEMQDWLKKRGQ